MVKYIKQNTDTASSEGLSALLKNEHSQKCLYQKIYY